MRPRLWADLSTTIFYIHLLHTTCSDDDSVNWAELPLFTYLHRAVETTLCRRKLAGHRLPRAPVDLRLAVRRFGILGTAHCYQCSFKSLDWSASDI